MSSQQKYSAYICKRLVELRPVKSWLQRKQSVFTHKLFLCRVSVKEEGSTLTAPEPSPVASSKRPITTALKENVKIKCSKQ